MSNYLKNIDKTVIINELSIDHLCKSHSFFVSELIISFGGEFLIYIVRVSAGLGCKSELECQLARIIDSCKSIRNSLPIRDTVKRKKMRIIKPSDLL